MKKREIAVESYLGIIAQRVLKWWKFLPAEVKATYSIDDMIGDVVIQVIKSARKKFDPKRAKASTFVWWVANNECLTILSRYKTKKRGIGMNVPMIDEVSRKLSSPDGALRLLQAKTNIEEMIYIASPSSQDFIDAALNGRRCKPSMAVRQELQEIAKAKGVTFSDFLLVKTCLVR